MEKVEQSFQSTNFPAEFQINFFLSQSGLNWPGYFLKYERERNRFSLKSQYSCSPQSQQIPFL